MNNVRLSQLWMAAAVTAMSLVAASPDIRLVDAVKHSDKAAIKAAFDAGAKQQKAADEVPAELSDAAIASIGLVLSGSVGSGRLFSTVDALATSARSELVARERIDRTRATYGSTMKRLVVIGLVLVLYLCIAGRDLVKPYGTVTGQVALCVPLAMWAGCVMWLRSLRRYGGAT